MLRSEMMTSGFSVRNNANPAFPLAALDTAAPLVLSHVTTHSRRSALSSTTRIRAPFRLGASRACSDMGVCLYGRSAKRLPRLGAPELGDTYSTAADAIIGE